MSKVKSYVFVLGRETELCFAELETVMGAIYPATTIQNLPTGVALVQHSGERREHLRSGSATGDHSSEVKEASFDPIWWQNRLGGTRLIARVLAIVPSVSAAAIHATLAPDVREVALSSPTVSVGERRKLLQGLKRLRPNLRYRENHDAYLASGLSERLIRRSDAAELILIQSEKTSEVGPGPSSEVKNPWLIAQVVAVQDTEAWTERDRGLPEPDAVVGMLPPKVARMMVNLAEPARKRRELSGESREKSGKNDLTDSTLNSQLSTLLDPFCGSGQIPIEGLRLGWNVVASDLDAQGIERTKTNLTWAQLRSAAAASQSWEAFQADVGALIDRVAPGSVDAIVTEPDLGPPLRSSTAAPSSAVLDGVAQTIRFAFNAGRALIRSGGRLVIVIPIIASNRIADRLDDSVQDGYILRATLHYARPDSRVEREIFVFDRI